MATQKKMPPWLKKSEEGPAPKSKPKGGKGRPKGKTPKGNGK